MTNLDTIVAKFRAQNKNIAAAFDEVERRLTLLEQSAPVIGSGIPMPVGDLPGWKLVYADDLLTDVALGQFPQAVSGRWDAYPNGWKDGTGGTYRPSMTVTVKDSVMDIHQHSEIVNGVREYLSAVVLPKISQSNLFGGGKVDALSYARCELCWRVTDAVPGYKFVPLLWPADNKWPLNGEIDWPEGDANGNFAAFMHNQGATVGPDAQGFYPAAPGALGALKSRARRLVGAAASGVPLASGWHVTTTEWLPNRCTFLLDGKKIGEATTRIPSTPMSWALQSQVWYGTPKLPAVDAETHVQVDWARVLQPA